MSMDRADRFASSLRSVLLAAAQVSILVLIITTMTGANLTA
jgi:hypothetical protein